MEEPPVFNIAKEDVEAMSPLEAWNKALEVSAELSGWSAFWDDGRSTDSLIDKLKFS